MKVCLSCNHSFTQTDWSCPECRQAPHIVDDRWLAFSPELAEHNEGFPIESFSHLYDRESTNFWFRARNQLILWALGSQFPQAENFLEIGCGTGFVLSSIYRAMPHLDLYGSEIYVEGLKFAAKRLPRAGLMQMDARKLPFDAEFDVIGMFDVLEHIDEDETALQSIHGALKERGGLILTVPQHMCLWSPADEFAKHCRRYSRQELSSKLEKAGFHVQVMRSFVSSLFPLMYMSRLATRSKPAAEYDPEAEYRLGSLGNAVLEGMLTVENALIKGGLNLPFGGSLLAVARKR